MGNIKPAIASFNEARDISKALGASEKIALQKLVEDLNQCCWVAEMVIIPDQAIF